MSELLVAGVNLTIQITSVQYCVSWTEEKGKEERHSLFLAIVCTPVDRYNDGCTLNALNDYLQNTLLITSDAVRQAINNQGIEALNDFATLTEMDIMEICTNVRKPGGTMPNPMHDPNNVVPGIPPTIANPGVTLRHVHEKCLKALCYYIYLLTRIQ